MNPADQINELEHLVWLTMHNMRILRIVQKTYCVDAEQHQKIDEKIETLNDELGELFVSIAALKKSRSLPRRVAAWVRGCVP